MRTLFHFYKNKPEWMQELYSQLRISVEERKFITPVILVLSIVLVIVIAGHSNKTAADLIASQNKRSDTIFHELKDISLVLHDVESNPLNTKQQQTALQLLEKDVSLVQKSIVDVAKSGDIQKIATQMTSVKNDIDTQLTDIKKAVSQSTGGKQYMDISILPFKVNSVDVIGGQPYASVQYGGSFTPMAVGDLLAGWRMVTADYDAWIVEFVNDKNQYIKVNLSGVGE
jgi:hypothetical protein